MEDLEVSKVLTEFRGIERVKEFRGVESVTEI